MKKFLDHALMLFAVAALCVGFSSCDSDDEGNGGVTGASSAVSVGGINASFSHVYWLPYDADLNADGEYEYEIQFYSFDYLNALKSQNYNAFPQIFHTILISFTAPGTFDELPEGSWVVNDYNVSGALGVSMQNDGEGEYYIEEGDNSGNLVITKSNGKYTVAIKPLEIEYWPFGEDEANEDVVKLDFTYTGTITRIPDEYLDEM